MIFRGTTFVILKRSLINVFAHVKLFYKNTNSWDEENSPLIAVSPVLHFVVVRLSAVKLSLFSSYCLIEYILIYMFFKSNSSITF